MGHWDTTTGQRGNMNSAQGQVRFKIGVAEEAEARCCAGQWQCCQLLVSCQRRLRCVSGQSGLVRARSGGGDTNCSRLHSGLIKTRHTNCHHQLILSCQLQHRFFKQSLIIVLYDTCILPRYHAIVRTSQFPCTKQQ